MCVHGTQREAKNELATAVSSAIVEKYDVLQHLGHGVYGTVMLCKDKKTQELVAVKQLVVDKQECDMGAPTHILREVVTLQSIKHPHVVQFKGIEMTSPLEYSLILEYVETDLHKVLEERRKMQKYLPMDLHLRYTWQLLDGIHACHVRRIVHRDLKPQNILVGKDGLKISDFGLARPLTVFPAVYTHNVITLWYRAPELLLGGRSVKYGPEIDMWSTGCVIAEMATSYPLFPGDSEIGTILNIMRMMGTPTEEMWPGVTRLEHFGQAFPRWKPTHLSAVEGARPELGEAGIELLQQLLTYNPGGRLTARRAKGHRFLANQNVDPQPVTPQAPEV